MDDIRSREDLQILIDTFYTRLLEDPELKPVFANIDLEAHLPRIVDFWAFVLLDQEGYTTNVFDKHAKLPIRPFMFDVWLNIWLTTVDGLFAGEKAELAKQRATVLAFTFKSKWEKLHPES